MSNEPKRTIVKVIPDPVKDQPAPPTESELAIDSSDLLDKTMIVLQREVKSLLSKSANGKLEPSHAKDLVQYIELLTDIEADKINKLSQMTNEQLEAIAKSERKERNRERMRVNKMRKNADQPTSSATGNNPAATPTEE